MKKEAEYLVVGMDDDFQCKCGNDVSDSGFFPCNEYGESEESTDLWRGYCKCAQCDQVYLPF